MEARTTSSADASPPFETKFTRTTRRFFRWYRNSPAPLGHGLLRRLLRLPLQRHQRIILRNGLRLEVDLEMVVQHTIFWLDGDMEPQLSWAVREFLPLGGAFIDCGANCGYVGLEARLYRQARVLFIEPHPQLAATIRRNVLLNKWESDCRVVEAAASDASGSATLFECADYDGSHSLLADWSHQTGPASRIEVPVLTVRQLMETEPGFNNVDFLKVDTEGNDIKVLRGLGDWLCPERIPIIYAELGRERDAAVALLEQGGYVGFGYRPRSGGELRRLTRRWAQGERLSLFVPLESCLHPVAETLWCCRGSVSETHLRDLAAFTSVLESKQRIE